MSAAAPVSRPTNSLQRRQEDEDFTAFSTSARSLEAPQPPSSVPEPTSPRSCRSIGAGIPSESLFIGAGDRDKKNDHSTHEVGDEGALIKREKYVTPKDFELLTVIGMGAFGKVLQVRNKLTGKVAAMKVISKRLLRRKSSYARQMKLERDILTRLQHPFIVRMHCSFQTKEKLFIVMDFLAGGELFLRMGREGVFLEKQAAFYLAEITLALEHMHSHDVLHRDLKPENVLLGSDGHVCLTDFGLAKDFTAEEGWSAGASVPEGDECATESEESNTKDYPPPPSSPPRRARTICGTTEYMAPEMIAKKGYGKAADFWSLGCIAYEMLSGRTPFNARSEKDILRKILNERVKMPEGSSARACKLLKGLLNRNPGERLGAAKGTMFHIGGVTGLKKADFFSGIDWVMLERKEIDPPAQFTVDGDDDLRHFHEEFLQMSLPRSVTEMGADDFVPRRCESDAFKGFSFIHEDFELPDRDDKEYERYWNSADPDGESLSECASSILSNDSVGGDGGPFGVQNGINSGSADAPKKKRPPRKKKKKKNKDIAAATVVPLKATEEIHEGDRHSIAEEKAKKKVDGKKEKAKHNDDTTTVFTGVTSNSVNKASTHRQKICQVVAVPPVATGSPSSEMKSLPKNERKKEAWQKVAKNPLPQSAPQKSSPQVMSSSVGPVKSLLPSAMTKKPCAESQLTSLKATSAGSQAYKPAPGSWAAKTITSSTTTVHIHRPNTSHGSTATASRTIPEAKAAPGFRLAQNQHNARPAWINHSSGNERPALATQAAFWPSLGSESKGQSRSPKKSASGGAVAAQGVWGTKRQTPATKGPWKAPR